MKSRFEIPIELIPNEEFGWMFILLALSLLFGFLRLVSGNNIESYAAIGLLPNKFSRFEIKPRLPIDLVQTTLLIINSIAVSYIIHQLVPPSPWIKSMANFMPYELIYFLLVLISFTIYYYLYYLIFNILERNDLGLGIISSSIMITSIISILAIPIGILNYYQPDLLSNKNYLIYLGLIMAIVVLWRLIIRTLNFWTPLGVSYLHRIIYLCTFEIVPVLIGVKYFTTEVLKELI
jgi:magnesium-transporting ATPase (P-type)